MRRKKNLGHSFSDMIDQSRSREFVVGRKSGYFDPLSDNFRPATEQIPANHFSIWQASVVALVIIVFLAIISSRLFWLQVIEGAKNRQYADSNRLQTIRQGTPRGLIYDRNQQILARNGPGYRLTPIEPGLTEFVKDEPKVRFLTEDQANRLRATDPATAAKLTVDQIRQYPDGEIFAHVLGYLGEISPTELATYNLQGCSSTTFAGQIDQSRNCDYRLGDLVGREGVESVYETVLRGVSGKKLVEVDADGRTVANISIQDPKPGLNLVLSLDAGLQKASYEALKEAITKVGSIPIKSGSTAGPDQSRLNRDQIGAGAVVAANPSSGEIYALVSYPSYDPGIFVDPAHSGKLADILNNRNHVLLNRAIAGTYPPGSTFKIVSAVAGLESGKVKADTKVEDTGVIYLGSFAFPNWYWIQYGKTEGLVDIVKAIARSNDIFFYRVGEWVGNEIMAQFARIFGMGQKLGIDLLGETGGLVPTDTWKKQTQGEPWYPGDTLHMAIGQGYVLATPLQIMSATAVIANGGTLYQPHLLQKIISREGQVLWQAKPKVIRSQIIKEANLKLVKEGLTGACATGGTGWPLFEFRIKNSELRNRIDNKNFFSVAGMPDDVVHIPVACKTGTAEFGDVQNRTHAWFTTYAPLDQPEIVITVLIEGGGEGSSIAGPVARKIYEYWFGN